MEIAVNEMCRFIAMSLPLSIVIDESRSTAIVDKVFINRSLFALGEINLYSKVPLIGIIIGTLNAILPFFEVSVVAFILDSFSRNEVVMERVLTSLATITRVLGIAVCLKARRKIWDLICNAKPLTNLSNFVENKEGKRFPIHADKEFM
uniref:Uncharacterized protein n=1 Tax=Glossina brevipalpis TaxID=37001 RepID=A0A1A9WL60_9MUSC